MSHTATVKTELKNAAALKKAAEALKLEHQVGQHKVHLYGGDEECDFSVKLPGWNYPVTIQTKTGVVKFDNFNGSWGKMEEFQKFNQEYGLQVAENTDDVQGYVAQGWQVERLPQTNGDIQLRLYK